MLFCAIAGFCLFNAALCVTKIKIPVFRTLEKGLSPKMSKASRHVISVEKKGG
jgi:hypothetical protein